MHITPERAIERLREGALYLDVRTPEEFEEGHPAGAWNLPVRLRSDKSGLADNPRFEAIARACLEPERELVVGCRSGPRAEHAAELLARHHRGPITVMNGGMEGRRDAFGEVQVPGWKQRSLPLSYESEHGYESLLLRAADRNRE